MNADGKCGANRAGVRLDDFYAYMPMHSYIYAPTRELWPASSVNARVPPPAKGIKASLWLDQRRPVEQMTWAPGSPMLIANRLISEGGWIGFQFYDHSKSYIASPPDVLRVDEKHIREHAVLNCLGVIITTNHKTDGIYLPADDRRHFVAWSDLTKEQFEPDYWTRLWDWYHSGGDRHVAAFLAELDLASFDAKAPPPKTQAFWEIVDSSRAPEDGELADAIDLVGSPAALTLSQIAARAPEGFADWLRDRKNTRRIPHRLEACGYVAVRNDDAKDGLWKIDGKRQVIYAKAELALRDRLHAARDIAGI
jgi:hypothetical protein